MAHEVVVQHCHCALPDVQLTKKNLQMFKNDQCEEAVVAHEVAALLLCSFWMRSFQKRICKHGGGAAQHHHCTASRCTASRKQICKHLKNVQCEEGVVAHEVVAQYCRRTASRRAYQKRICKHLKKINVRKQWWHMKWWHSIVIASGKEPHAASGKSAANV